jgi:hypothetical protein
MSRLGGQILSATVLHFTPRAELQPTANLDAFIELCKQSDVLDARNQFEQDVWNLAHLKGQNKANRAIFSSIETAPGNAPDSSMSQPFLNFAKAALVYLHDKRPVVSQAVRLSALRFLEASLRNWGLDARPTAVTADVLDTAVEMARNQVSAGVAYRVAGQLELIAELLDSKDFISLRQTWHHGMKKPSEHGSRISKDAIEAREKKLPSAAALRALAGIFHQATDPADVLVSSYTALMLCAPERINEVLRLIRNCMVDGDGRFKEKLGLRWAGSKGASDTTKWLPSEMAPVAREAVANLLKVTAPAHVVATWYTANPRSLYLHDKAVHLRGKTVLTTKEVALILWGDESKSKAASVWATRTNSIIKVALAGGGNGFKFADVERAVLSMLPPTFPYVPGAPDLLCKNSLALIRFNENHAERATYLCMFSCVDHGIITNAFGRGDRESIFKRFNYTEDDGSPIELRSHSLRHYLNMLAQMGGLSSAEIAIFSGRKDVRQNRAYDHMSSDDVQAPITQAIRAGFTVNLVPLASRNLITRSEFKGIGIVAAHTTEYGWCHHNFASEPCQMYRDCINCEEQECVKGDTHKEANLRILKDETEYLLNQARQALTDEEYGADAWVVHQTKTLERVNALLFIFDDPSVPSGARIRLKVENAPIITSSEAAPVTQAVMFERRKRLK